MSTIKRLKPLVRFLHLMGVIAILLWLCTVVTTDWNLINQLSPGDWLRYVFNLAVQFSLGVTQIVVAYLLGKVKQNSVT